MFDWVLIHAGGKPLQFGNNSSNIVKKEIWKKGKILYFALQFTDFIQYWVDYFE